MHKVFGYTQLFAAAAAAVAVLYMFAVRAPSETLPAALPAAATAAPRQESAPQPPVPLTYIQITDGCGPYFKGACVNARSGPGEEYPVVLRLRAGAVLKTADIAEAGGHGWYKIAFDEWLRYPERAHSDLYVAADYATPFTDPGPQELPKGVQATSTKHILIDRSEQMLYAYDGGALFMKTPVSTGLDLTPTPRGNFAVYLKTPSRYMQGPLPGISDQYYDLPGVPWNLYFTPEGGAIHGTYWHDHFGEEWSHGCVNLPLDAARALYDWAPLGTKVIVRD